MSLKEKVKFLWEKNEVTSFRTFKEYFFVFLNLSGFNVLRENFFTGFQRKFLIVFIGLLPVTGFFTSLWVIWNYSNEIEEVIVSTVSWIMTFQAANKLLELLIHRQNHKEMISIVTENTEKLETDRDFFEIGVKNYQRARFYIALSVRKLMSSLSSELFEFSCRLSLI
jgi:hypothetical protein